MGVVDYAQAGGIVATAGFEANVPVLDNVYAADPVAAADGVAGDEEGDRVGDCSGDCGRCASEGGEFRGDAFCEFEGEVFGFVGSGDRVVGHFPHVVWWCGVFKGRY